MADTISCWHRWNIMTELKDYSEIKVELISVTPGIEAILDMAMNMTMKQDYSATGDNLPGRVRRLIEMGHTSLFEHINYTFIIEGASRNFLSQMTRHRIASYTSGSQHYQNYQNYDVNMSSEHAKLFRPELEAYINDGTALYNDMLQEGIPREEARQILPGGMQNNLMATMNARSLMNFFNLRLCRRNVKEMQVVAKKMFQLCYPTAPYIWNNIGADCYLATCRQGSMNCKKGKMSLDEIMEERK